MQLDLFLNYFFSLTSSVVNLCFMHTACIGQFVRMLLETFHDGSVAGFASGQNFEISSAPEPVPAA
jgi:hypothetical protein